MGDTMEYTVHLLNKNNKDFFVEHSETTTNDDHIDDFLKDESTLLFYAANEDEVCGVIYGYVLRRLDTLPMLYIHSVDVYERFRRLGIGSSMVQAMIEYAQKNDFYKVFLITNKSNEKAVKLYTKAGGTSKFDDDLVFEWKKKQ